MGQQYNRAFITLKNDRPGYGMNSRMPSGRCIIETRGDKGKLSILVQDLKPNIFYKAYIIHAKDSVAKGFPIGTVVVDTKGRGEFKLEFDVDNVCSSGLLASDINVVAIFVNASEQEGIVSPLVGYKDEMIRWKHRFVDMSKKNVEGNEFEVTKEPALEPEQLLEAAEVTDSAEDLQADVALEEEFVDSESENITEKPIDNNIEIGWIHLKEVSDVENTDEQPIENSEEILFDKIKKQVSEEKVLDTELDVQTQEGLIEHIEETTGTNEPAEQFAKASDFFDDEEVDEQQEIEKDIHETFKTMAQQFRKELEELEFYAFYSEEDDKGNVAVQSVDTPMEKLDELSFLFENNAKMIPFKTQKKEVEWIRIGMKELVLLPLDCWHYMNQPFLLFSHNRYKHLILGRVPNADKNEYYVGVPAQYSGGYLLRANQLGFQQFKCCEDIQPMEGEYGYWLMRIEG